MDGEDVNMLDGYFQMAILLYRNYFTRISFCLRFRGTSLQNILMKLLLSGCLRSKRQTTHCAPSSLALYGVDALHVWALRKCALMLQLFSCRNTRIWGRIGWGHSMRTSHSAFSGSMGSTFRRESSCSDST